MNWIHTIRFGGGYLSGDEVRRVRQVLTASGFETELAADTWFIGHLFRNGQEVWRFSNRVGDYTNALRFVNAIGNVVETLDSVFGAHSLDHLSDEVDEPEDDEELQAIIDEFSIAPTLHVGAATKLPLP